MVHSQVMRKTRARNAIKQQEKISIDFVILSIRNTPLSCLILYSHREKLSMMGVIHLPDVSIVIKSTDRFSDAIKTMSKSSKAFSKDMVNEN